LSGNIPAFLYRLFFLAFDFRLVHTATREPVARPVCNKKMQDREDTVMTVSSIIAVKGREVITAQPGLTLHEVARVLAERRIGAVVVAGADGAIKGILSERDIVRALAKSGADSLQEPVSMHMTAKVMTCQESDMITDVMEIMTKGRFRHVPVVRDGKLAGMISIGDVVKQRIAETEAESQSLRDYIQMAS
jgi:CBS domain-containing protein